MFEGALWSWSSRFSEGGRRTSFQPHPTTEFLNTSIGSDEYDDSLGEDLAIAVSSGKSDNFSRRNPSSAVSCRCFNRLFISRLPRLARVAQVIFSGNATGTIDSDKASWRTIDEALRRRNTCVHRSSRLVLLQ